MRTTLRRFTFVAIVAAGLAVLVPTTAVPAQKDTVVSWTGTTPPDGSVLGVAAGTRLYFRLSASVPTPGGTIRIRTNGSAPHGVVLHTVDGNPAAATFSWTPRASQVGEYRINFSASVDPALAKIDRTFVVRVGPRGKAPPGPNPPEGVYPQRFDLHDRANETYRWAFVRHHTVARSGPSTSARKIVPISMRTPEYYRNAILVLNAIKYKNGETWYRIRLAILPNGSTGWVRRGALTGLQRIHTRMVINRGALRATLYKRGRVIFSAGVGVGQPQWPTPRGEYYIREKLSGYYAPAYGPRAFGLNARSSALPDWPGGGFIGIHGTNQPSILPGRVSHGCVRMRNAAIMRLFRLMPIGTPVTIL